MKAFKTHAVRIEIPQPEREEGTTRRVLYAFPFDGKRILDIATVSRVHRDDNTGELSGFQRDVVKNHIREIKRYIESEDAMIPNAIVIAFDRDLDFTAVPTFDDVYATAGILSIPDLRDDGDARPGFIIDGQQRTYAIQDAKVQSFPIMVCAFIEADSNAQAQQFVNVNSAKALPRALINELLPQLIHVPDKLSKRQTASVLAHRLAFDFDSPLSGIVRSETHKKGTVQLNSLIQPIESLISNAQSVLGLKIPAEATPADLDPLVQAVKNYWTAVSRVFPDAWNRSTTDSRLTHGVGIWALTNLFDVLLREFGLEATVDDFVYRLEVVAPHCHWTHNDGDWIDVNGFGQDVAWNAFQNTHQDKTRLTTYLIRKYLEAGSNGNK